MSNEPLPKCPRCGAPLKESVAAGLCSNCLAALNLKAETAGSPESIKVFAVVNIILGAVGIVCCSPYSWVVVAGNRQNGLVVLILLFLAITMLPASCVTLTSGIGLCYRKSWARQLAVWKSVYNILVMLFTQPIILLAILFDTVMPGGAKVFNLAFSVSLDSVFLAYNILLIYFLTRKEAMRAVGENA